MNFTTETLENLCRTCMCEGKDNKTISIFNETERIKDNNVTIMELLLLTTPQLNIETGDMLPKVLCENCFERLVNAYEFQRMCIKVEETLRQMYNECSTLKSQALMDPLNDTAVVNQTINDLANILKLEMDEPLIDSDVPLGDNKNDVVKYEAKGNQWSSDDSVPFEDGIDSEESEWKFFSTVAKTAKRSKAIQRNAKNASDNTSKNVEHNLDKICNTASKICKEIKKDSNESNNMDEKNKNFACDECGSHLKTRKGLQRHKKIHLKSPAAGRKNNQAITRYECKFCQKVFQQSSSLKDHLRTHTGEQPYLCSECGKAFKSLSNMKQHFLRHGTDRPYACPDCPKRFPCLSDLASHKIVHNNKKSHVCDVCGSGFSKPYLLKKHKMYHTGEKNHKCDYCEMRFVLADQCRRHMRTHTGEKPYKCKYCERAFAQSNDLIKHLRGHLGDNVYKCDLCPQGFRLQGDLRAHFYTHKNDDEETRARNLQALKDEELRIQMKFGLIECK